MAHRQISILPLAMQKRVVQEQPGKQKAQRNLPGNGKSARVRGLGGSHLPEFDPTTLNLIAAQGQEPRLKRMSRVGLPGGGGGDHRQGCNDPRGRSDH